jgi:hypothetical protein
MKRTDHLNAYKMVCRMCPCACYTPAQIEQAL